MIFIKTPLTLSLNNRSFSLTAFFKCSHIIKRRLFTFPAKAYRQFWGKSKKRGFYFFSYILKYYYSQFVFVLTKTNFVMLKENPPTRLSVFLKAKLKTSFLTTRTFSNLCLKSYFQDVLQRIFCR